MGNILTEKLLAYQKRYLVISSSSSSGSGGGGGSNVILFKLRLLIFI